MHGYVTLQKHIEYLITGRYQLDVDCLRMLVWMNTADGAKNINRPKSLVEELIETPNQNREFEVFESGEDFEARRRKIIEGV